MVPVWVAVGEPSPAVAPGVEVGDVPLGGTVLVPEGLVVWPPPLALLVLVSPPAALRSSALVDPSPALPLFPSVAGFVGEEPGETVGVEDAP